MFSLPTNGSTNESYDGAPLFQMQDDAGELAELIGALYDLKLPPMRLLDPQNPERASAALKLAKKYEVGSICARIKCTKLRAMFVIAVPINVDIGPFIPEPASAIRFAREFNVPSILPAAFYTLALTDVQRNWDSADYRPFHAAR
ncbi:uncharacterized protein PHACADRAFT_23719 [Phanerochaete carnosa HHB-10118-sp]|uniref:BTB domain-containing protein n=1 Tax=Phanerochaete carnosa (strain HHB-10118-sp) TaxID=650164 RepID=K5W8V0_PHACS|nr:uncharacterized protein PHACADRAFT_23719 [Phanerochaete carnosa HHB-10118-sp]EKM60343.1 hypothetical protein PHACADRAFT_23719 [Phanerochaete carnosa HHB-10118-sp]